MLSKVYLMHTKNVNILEKDVPHHPPRTCCSGASCNSPVMDPSLEEGLLLLLMAHT